jgi:hypothetical protein
MQVSDGFILPMQDEGLFVSSMRHEFLQFGIRQIGLQLLLKDGLAFRRRKFGEKSNVPGFKRIFPGFPFAQKKRSAVSQAKCRRKISLSGASAK